MRKGTPGRPASNGDNRALAISDATKIIDRWLAAWVRAVIEIGALPPWPLAVGSENAPGLVALVSRRVEFHGIAVLLCDHRAEPAGCPAPVMAAVRALGRRALLEEELQRAVIRPLIEDMGAQGIPVMGLKGIALAHLVYDRPAKRPRGDTDLLVPDTHFPAVHACLLRAGWSRARQPHGVVLQETWAIDCGAGTWHKLDLHRSVTDRPVLQSILRDADFWRDAVPLDRLSPCACSPGPLHLLLHGAVNQAWHEARGFFLGERRVFGERRLIWHVDHHHLTARFTKADWEDLVALCRETGAGPIVHSALSGAQADIGLAVPEGVLGQLQSHVSGTDALDFIRRIDVVSNTFSDLQALGSISERWRLVRHLVFAPRSHLIEKYPQASHWPTALLQLRRQVEGVARLAARLAGGRARKAGKRQHHAP